MKVLSLMLFFGSAALSFKHGWDAFQPSNAEQANMMADLGITKAMMPFVGAFSILLGLLLFFPKTFFLSNLLNALTILLIMAFSLKAGNYKIAFVEIPFLAIPLLLIWLKFPIDFPK